MSGDGQTGPEVATDPGSPPSTAGEPDGSEVVLALTDVVKAYPGPEPVPVLHGIDLTVRAGEWVAIVGPSGSGKSTLLNLVGALDQPTSGTVEIAGHDVSRLDDRRRSALRGRAIGFVFQSFHLVDGLTALENAANGLLYRGVPARERRRRAKEALERVGLGHRLDHVPGRLSGGEQQRVAIARAIVGEPGLLLADEPTGNLDTRTGDDILRLFESLHAAGATILLITHDAKVAEAAPRRVTIRDGRLLDSDREPAG